jgi:uncharacterized membrane protein
MSLSLSNPKTFLALLLFIGLLFVLIGFTMPAYTLYGGLLIAVAIGLWILKNRDDIGF